MRKIKRVLIWYCMYSKRLLFKWSFILLLCLIPVIVPIINQAMSEGGSVLEIVLCYEDNDKLAKKMVDTLMDSDGIISFSFCKSEHEAREAVENHRADAAWVFRKDFSERTEDYVSGKDNDPIVLVIERESNVPLQLSKEILCGAVYKNISYYIYRDYVYENIVPESELAENELREYYDNIQRGGAIIELSNIGSENVSETDSNYLTAPLRGILSIMIVLCTMASALYFMKDQLDGKYAWLQPYRRIIPAFASCLSAAVFSAVAVLFAMKFGNIFTKLNTELFAMLLFVIATIGFTLALSRLFKSPGKFGAVIPGILIVMLVLSPIFFKLNVLKPIRLMLPTYYYLNVIYNSRYYLYMIIYCVAVYTVAFLLNIVTGKKCETGICD